MRWSKHYQALVQTKQDLLKSLFIPGYAKRRVILDDTEYSRITVPLSLRQNAKTSHRGLSRLAMHADFACS